MLKFVVAILSLVYLSSTVGATVHFHYCMDRLVDAGLWKNEGKQCGKCGMEKSDDDKKGCCKDEHKQYKLENDHKGATAFQLSPIAVESQPVAPFQLASIYLPSVTEENPLSHAPPRSSNIAIHIRHCVFRI